MSEPLPRRALIDVQPEAEHSASDSQSSSRPIRAGRPLPLRAEIRRQLRRRRTQGIFVVLLRAAADPAGGVRARLGRLRHRATRVRRSGAGERRQPRRVHDVRVHQLPADRHRRAVRRRHRALRGELVEPALPAWRPRYGARRLHQAEADRRWPRSSIVALFFLPAWTLVVGGIAYGWGPYVGPDRRSDRLAGLRRPVGDHRLLSADRAVGRRGLRVHRSVS